MTDPQEAYEDAVARKEAKARQEELEAFQEISDAFDTLCQERHNEGQKEYGTFTFLGNDVVRMMMEELADTANYCRYQFIKLMILQDALEQQKAPAEVKFEGFKGVGEVGWKKS
jgi:hypothetical protein